MVDADGAGRVADNVQRRTAHVKQAVDAVDDADVGRRDADSLEDHCQHDHARTGGTGGADGGKGRGDDDGDHLRDAEVHADALCQEDCSHALIDRGAVHVDRCAERQNERGNVLLNTHLIAALLGNRQRSDGGRGGEGEHSCGQDTLEELQGAHAGENLDGQAVNENGVNDVADVCRQQNQTQRAEDLRTLRRDDPAHQTEHADRGNAEDEGHDRLRDLVERGNERCKGLALFAGYEDAAAEQQRDDNDLEHRSVDHRLHRVGREDVLDRGHDVAFLCLICRVFGKRQNREAALEEVCNHKPDHAGNCSRGKEVHNGLPADLTDLADIAHGEHAVHDGKQNQRHNNELQKVDENVSEGLEIACRKIGGSFCTHGCPENRAKCDTGSQTDHDPYAKTELLLFFHRLFSPQIHICGSFHILPHCDSNIPVNGCKGFFASR